MAVMGITGAILAWYRIPTFYLLLHTRFGILLLIKIGLYLVMVIGLRHRPDHRSLALGVTGETQSNHLA